MSSNRLNRFLSASWLPSLLALLAGLFYLVQLWIAAHTQDSVLDEGAYIYKGWLFASGQYRLFQPYGPWTNQMPLSFLIPGIIQVVFGTGLAQARYFMIFIALLTLLGLWICARRLVGPWWATAAVWIFVWNPAVAKMYAVAVSQGLVVCMLVWAMALSLGEKRPIWQLALAGVLSGMLIMTRINMLPVLPLLAVYVYWQHGRRGALITLFAGLLIVIIGHASLWPDILYAWVRLPRSLTPFLDQWRLPKAFSRTWSPESNSLERLISFFHMLRLHFVLLFGSAIALVFFPSPAAWKRRSNFRIALFLAFLFSLLLIMHIWAALGNDYCVFCAAGYTAFFSPLGLLLGITVFSTLLPDFLIKIPVKTPAIWILPVILLILVLFAGIGLASFEQTDAFVLGLSIPRWLLGGSGGGSATIEAVLVNKFGLETAQLRQLVPSLFGLAAGFAFLSLVAAAMYFWDKRHPTVRLDFNRTVLLSTISLGIILSPNFLLGGGYVTYDCSGNLLSSYEAAGRHIAAVIPPGSQVYWRGTYSVVPLLYAPAIDIYPSQINGDYSFFSEGESEAVLRFGGWNQELAERWTKEADYLIIQQRYYNGWLRDRIETNRYERLESTPRTIPCRPDSVLFIFKRRR